MLIFIFGLVLLILGTINIHIYFKEYHSNRKFINLFAGTFSLVISIIDLFIFIVSGLFY